MSLSYILGMVYCLVVVYILGGWKEWLIFNKKGYILGVVGIIFNDF